MSISAGTVVGYLDLDTSKFKSALKDAQSTLSDFTNKSNSAGTRFESLGSTLKSVGSNMSKYVTLPLTAIGTASVSTAANFEKSMSQVAATMGITVEEINNGSESYKKLEQAALDMGATTEFSASEASEALNYLALAGYDVDKSVSTLPTVLDLAAAGGLDLAYASDLMTDAMSALGLETTQAEGFVDQLAKTSQKSNTSVGQLGEAILTVGGTAKVLAGGTTEMNTALGILADNGIKGAEGGTALRNVILSLSAPTDKAAKTMKKMGLEVFDAQGNMRPLNEIFKDLDGTLSTMTQGEQTKVLSELFNKVDLKSVNALLSNSGERFNELSGYIADSSGAASDMADTMNNNLSGQLTLLKSGLEGAAISIGNALLPVIKVLVEWINNLVTWFNNLNPGIQTAITIFGLVVAAIGPVLLIVGQLTLAISAISAPVLIVIGVITALIAVGVLLYKNWDTIKAKCSEIWSNICDSISKFVSDSIQWVKDKWDACKQWLSDCWNSVKQSAVDIWNSVCDSVSKFISDSIKLVKDKWEEGKQWLVDCWNNVKQTAVDMWSSIFDFFTETIPQWIDNVGKWFDELPYRIGYALGNGLRIIIEWGISAWDYLATNVPKWIDEISNWFKELPGKIWTWLSNTVTKIKEWASEVYQNVKEWGDQTYQAVKESVSKTVDTIIEWVSQLPGKIWAWLLNVIQKFKEWGDQTYQKAKDAVNRVLNVITEWFSQLPGKVWAWLSNTIQKINEWRNNMIKKAKEVGSKTVESVVNGFKNLPGKIKEIGSEAVKSLWNGISSMASWIKNKVSSFVSGLIDGFKGVKSGISSAIGKGRMIEMPDISQRVNVIGENDYSQTKFDYVKARQTTVSDVMATNYSMLEALKGFESNIKSNNKEVKTTTENSFSINLNIEKFVNEREQDVNQLVDEIGFLLKRKVLG